MCFRDRRSSLGKSASCGAVPRVDFECPLISAARAGGIARGSARVADQHVIGASTWAPSRRGFRCRDGLGGSACREVNGGPSGRRLRVVSVQALGAPRQLLGLGEVTPRRGALGLSCQAIRAARPLTFARRLRLGLGFRVYPGGRRRL